MNYLRVRGEYSLHWAWLLLPWELPPRARRIPHPIAVSGAVHGTTSACAENTVDGFTQFTEDWNYLRVRGEYIRRSTLSEQAGELPPRARRIPCGKILPNGLPGTTSACAENTGC